MRVFWLVHPAKSEVFSIKGARAQLRVISKTSIILFARITYSLTHRRQRMITKLTNTETSWWQTPNADERFHQQIVATLEEERKGKEMTMIAMWYPHLFAVHTYSIIVDSKPDWKEDLHQRLTGNRCRLLFFLSTSTPSHLCSQKSWPLNDRDNFSVVISISVDYFYFPFLVLGDIWWRFQILQKCLHKKWQKILYYVCTISHKPLTASRSSTKGRSHDCPKIWDIQLLRTFSCLGCWKVRTSASASQFR